MTHRQLRRIFGGILLASMPLQVDLAQGTANRPALERARLDMRLANLHQDGASLPEGLVRVVTGLLANPARCGRRPAGLQEPGLPAGLPEVAAYFARMAVLEVASVDAFLVLGEELAVHGAPPALREAASEAARDERRHARTARALCRRYGAPIPEVHVERSVPRPLREVALENAVEGCVHETHAALLALWQAQASADPVVRAALGAIAEDETRHAELAWAIGDWAEERLDGAARRAVASARAEAAGQLLGELAVEPEPELVRWAGLPPAREAQALMRGLDRALWQAA